VTFGMALPLICGDLVVVWRAVAVLGHVVAALP
jgi:hypothetical protein